MASLKTDVLKPVPLLVVDDEDHILRIAQKSLSGKAGFQVVTAATGKEAMERLQEQPFDIMLTDLVLPDADGTALTKQVKERYPDIDVLIMTGYPTLDTTINTLKLGAYDYIIKPLDVWLLRAALHRCVEKRRLFQRLQATARASKLLNATLEDMTTRLKPFASGPKDIQETRQALEKAIQKMQECLKELNEMERQK